MIRARFYVNGDDYRPVNWPIKHPYWCSGYTDDDGNKAILVAYADNKAEIRRNWPDARKIDVMEKGLTAYTFTDRFAMPDWFNPSAAKNGGGK